MLEFSKKYKGSEILISKTRNTGYHVTIGETVLNIDVDFL